MKELQQDDMMTFEDVKSKVWMMFDILRSERIYSEDYQVILLFLSAYKDNLLPIDLSDDSYDLLKEKFNEGLRISTSERGGHYSSIFLGFEPSIQRLSGFGIQRLIHTLVEINKPALSKYFPEIFDSVLLRISQAQGREGIEFIQPIELTRFILNLADLKKDARVFNPFASLASFGVYLDQGQHYYGQELNQKTWALGALRLLAYERIHDTKYECKDSFLNWPDGSKKFDLIVTNLPYGIQFIQSYQDFEPNVRTFVHFLIENGVQSLEQNGKLIAVLPQSFLFREVYEQYLRKFLVDEDLIEIIISLPEGLFLNTEIPFVILVINKKKLLPGKVRFIDAKGFFSLKGQREKVFNDQELLSHLNGSLPNLVQEPTESYNSPNGKGNKIKGSDIERVVDLIQIKKFDYILSVERYFQSKIDGVKLGDILELVRGHKGNLPETGKLIRIRDLKDDKIDFTLDISGIEERTFNQPSIHCISESCLLLARRWRTLKPTLFEFTGQPILRNQDILSFKVNEAVVDTAFLINELHADYVQEQLESYRLGSSIRTEDLMEVVIKLPSLEEQRAKVEGLKQAFINAKEEELKLQKEILGIKEDTFKEFASIKHTFRQYLGAIESNVVGTRKFLNKRDGQIISLDDVYSKKLNQTLRDHLLSVEETIASLGKLLETEMFTSKGSHIETLNLIDLVEMAHKRFKQGHFTFELDCDQDSFGEIDENLIPLIDINKDDFFKLFSNIVSNAINHGFKTEHGNIIRSKISYESQFESCVLEVSNNGVPMPEKFTFTHLTTRGEKTTDSKGTGIGGADIKDIVTIYKGTFELFNEINSPFPVTYKINFPISKNMKEDEI